MNIVKIVTWGRRSNLALYFASDSIFLKVDTLIFVDNTFLDFIYLKGSWLKMAAALSLSMFEDKNAYGVGSSQQRAEGICMWRPLFAGLPASFTPSLREVFTSNQHQWGCVDRGRGISIQGLRIRPPTTGSPVWGALELKSDRHFWKAAAVIWISSWQFPSCLLIRFVRNLPWQL